MRTGEWVVAAKGRLYSTTVVRGVAGELEDEKWRLGSTTLVSLVIKLQSHTCFGSFRSFPLVSSSVFTCVGD